MGRRSGKKQEKDKRPFVNFHKLNPIGTIGYEAKSFSSQEKDVG
jgi:hypothetical protein